FSRVARERGRRGGFVVGVREHREQRTWPGLGSGRIGRRGHERETEFSFFSCCVTNGRRPNPPSSDGRPIRSGSVANRPSNGSCVPVAILDSTRLESSAFLRVFAPFGNLEVMPDQSRAEVVRGTLEMLALKLLSEESLHGWGLSLKLREISHDV